jgi:GR25 family glycosyltransferase involved in LPS biosynthesis
MRAFVINLAHRVDRREAFQQWNQRQPFRYEYFAAIDGKRVDRVRLAQQNWLDPERNTFNAGALGSALSHLALWQACAAGTEPFLIFEDDCCLRGDFWKHGQKLLSRYLSAHDMILLGFNTDAAIALRSGDGVLSAISFDERVKLRPGYFTEYSRLRDSCPNLFRCHQFWGTLAYAVSPSGARRLIEACFPLSSREEFQLIGSSRRAIRPFGIDGSINLALERGRLDVIACYPPLALGPNRHADSDIQVAQA